MSAGTVQNPSRPRYQSNERFDVGDASASSAVPRQFDTSLTRSFVSTPRNVGSTSPVGLILQGFDLTLNPTAPNDNEVEVNSDLGVALDSDGNLLIKEVGTELTFTLTTGTWQLYIYFQENATNLAKRRFTPVTGGAEFTQAIDTTYTGTINTYVRSGDNTSVVAQDNVNGATTPLCLLAVVIVSSGGAVTCVEGLTAWATSTVYSPGNPVVANGNIYVCQYGGTSASSGGGPSTTGSNINDNGVKWLYVQATGQNSGTAPNGTFGTNRLSAITPPSTAPATPFVNGSVATLHDLVTDLAYFLGQIGWKGSRNTPPSQVNNYQAFALPTVGLDALFDSQGETVLTPTTRYRDWNLNLRSLVDHNGYRMGQVSEIEEHWSDPVSTTVNYPLLIAQPTGGWSSTGSIWTCTSSGGGLYLPLDGVVPAGAVVIDVIFNFNRGTTSDSTEFFYQTETAGSPTNIVEATVTSGTGPATVHLLNSITPNALPQQMGFFGGTAVDLTTLVVSGVTVAASLVLTSVQVTYYMPSGWKWSGATTSYSAVTAGADLIAGEDPTSTNPARFIGLTGGAVTSPSAINGSSVLTRPAFETYLAASLVYVMEFPCFVNNTTAQQQFLLGVFGFANQFVGLYNDATFTNWQLQVAGVNTDTGIAVSTAHIRVRLEIFGSTANSSGLTKVRLYINGAKVAEQNVSTVSGVFSPYFKVGTLATTGSTTSGIFIGRVRRVWNLVASGDDL